MPSLSLSYTENGFFNYTIYLILSSQVMTYDFDAHNVPIMLLVFKGDKVEEASDASDEMRWVCPYFFYAILGLNNLPLLSIIAIM